MFGLFQSQARASAAENVGRYRERLGRLLSGPRATALDAPPRRRRRRAGSTNWSVSEIQALQTTPIFAGLPQSVLFALARELSPRTFAPGAVIIAEGEPGDSLWIIIAGTVEVSVANPLSGSVPVRVMQSGDHFGEISLITGQPRTATVTAVTTARLLEIDAEGLEGLARRYPRIAATLRSSCRRRALSAEEVEARGGIDALL